MNPNLDYVGQSLTYPAYWKLEDYEKKDLIVACTGRNVWNDLRLLNPSDMDVMCVKDTIVHYPGPVHHAFSQHADQLVHFIEIRKMRNPSVRRQANEIMAHTSSERKYPGVHAWNLPGHGTSSLGAVYVGLALGYRRIVLCGCPLDDTGHYYDPKWIKTDFIKRIADRGNHPKFWEHAAQHVFKGKVRSMSGRTKALLGPP